MAQLPSETVEKILRELVGCFWRCAYDSTHRRTVELAIKVMGLTCKAYSKLLLPQRIELNTLITVRQIEKTEEEDWYYGKGWYSTQAPEPWIPLDYRTGK